MNTLSETGRGLRESRISGTNGAKPGTPERRTRRRPAEWLLQAVQTLEAAGIERPRWVAEQLLARRLGQTPMAMLLEPVIPTEEQKIQFLAGVAACAAGMPMQYILGSAAFYGREFEVGPGVFIPRPETEILVETALAVIPPARRVLDVGTGSGAIGITLALERPDIQMTATERSEIALLYARRNARRLGASVEFKRSDLAASVPAGSVDLLAANLPYLDAAQATDWPVQLHWEPWLAQDGGEKGLAVIRRFMREASACLAPEGRMILEAGDGQPSEIGRFASAFGLKSEQRVSDLAGKERVIVLKKDSSWKH